MVIDDWMYFPGKERPRKLFIENFAGANGKKEM